MEPRRHSTSIRRQWQQAPGVVGCKPDWLWTHMAILKSQSCCEGFGLVTPSERITGERRWHSWPLHQILEHDSWLRVTVCTDWQPGMQPYVQQECKRARQHTWIFRERYRSMEVSHNEEACNTDRTQSPRALPRNEPRWRVYRDRRRRWNTPLLESIP